MSATLHTVLKFGGGAGVLVDCRLAEQASAGVGEGVPGVGRNDDHVACGSVDVGALDFIAALAVVEDEDLGVGMPMALRAAAGDDAGVHDRGDEAVVLAVQDAELAAVAHDRTVSELELGIRYVARLGWLGHVSPPGAGWAGPLRRRLAPAINSVFDSDTDDGGTASRISVKAPGRA